ncbi:hypothetical protein [Sulfuricystis multivorans]|nr:hypothetical protein [Sulfuricystis multivorans]
MVASVQQLDFAADDRRQQRFAGFQRQRGGIAMFCPSLAKTG